MLVNATGVVRRVSSLFSYLAGTVDFGNAFRKKSDSNLAVLFYANWANSPDNGESTPPFIIGVELFGAPVTFESWDMHGLTAQSAYHGG